MWEGGGGGEDSHQNKSCYDLYFIENGDHGFIFFVDIEACSVMLLHMLLYFILFFTILENVIFAFIFVIWHISNCSKLTDKNKIDC